MHALYNYYGVPIIYTFLDMSQPSVVCLSLRSAGIGIVGVRSAGVRRRSREARLRRACLLVAIMAIKWIFTPLLWQRAGYQQGKFWIYARLADWFTDIRRVHGYTHKRFIGCPITTDNGYKIVILPEYNYSALASYYILATVLVPGVQLLHNGHYMDIIAIR